MLAVMRRIPAGLFALGSILLAWSPDDAWAAAPKPGPPLTIQRAAGPIVVDGDLSDPGWQGITPITTWFETNVGDNVEPQVRNVGYLAYDDKFLYAAFHFEDPHPEGVRAPLGDHDNVSSATDYAGVIVDSRNDGKTARMFLSNPKGVQYDAVSSDVTGEDSSPDFYWDSMGKITATGWDLEIRIPFSSLRYANDSNPTWGILLYRNYPRDRRYQFFSARLPRDVNCFICNSSKMAGLAELPHGSHMVLAPFATGGRTDEAADGLGAPLQQGPVETQLGADLKWSPLADATIDGTINPDFSQVESDVAQIGANERFALFYPEKRPFFLEGIDLFTTPFQAVYTRSITAPSGGLRATGRTGTTAFTALVTHDKGGGLVILPGSQGSDAALQEFGSDVGIMRLRHDMGPSFVSVLATGREIDGGGHNAVIGPDFQWRPRPAEAITGQALWSDSRTPNRPDLAAEWDGRELSDHALLLNWSHNTPKFDWFIQGQQIGPEFRADEGFVPQVGFSEGYFETGYTLRPKDEFLSRVRLFTIDYYDADPDGNELARRVSVGAGMDGKLNSFVRIELNRDDIRVGNELLGRFRPRVYVQASPTRLFNLIEVDSYFGDEIDFANAREGSGTTIVTILILHPGDHLELRNDASGRRLYVTDASGRSGRLFNASVERLRAQWSFNSRSFIRLIGQYVRTIRDPSLYTYSVTPKDADLSGSALFAYKINWQT
ncbi:MAG: DUF5916 domain-containing protein, partial [Candidatus Eisenbacteria bacterium]